MTTLYHSYVGTHLAADGVAWFVMEATEERIGGRVFVKHGDSLREERDAWHENESAAMDEAAARIDAIAAKLVVQATEIRRKAAAVRAKQADEDERYDRGLPPRMEVPQ